MRGSVPATVVAAVAALGRSSEVRTVSILHEPDDGEDELPLLEMKADEESFARRTETN